MRAWSSPSLNTSKAFENDCIFLNSLSFSLTSGGSVTTFVGFSRGAELVSLSSTASVPSDEEEEEYEDLEEYEEEEEEEGAG
jgi:hypothetical protein